MHSFRPIISQETDSIRRIFNLAHAIAFGAMISTAGLAQDLQIEPIAFGMFRSTGDWWQSTDDPVSYAGAGIRGTYTNGNLHIVSEFVNSRFYGALGTPSKFTPEEGLGWKNSTTFQADEFDSDYTNLLLNYRFHDMHLLMGKYHPKWSVAEHSVLNSSKSPSVPRFGFDWQVLDWLNLKYDHGKLNSGLIDSILTRPSGIISRGRRVIRSRYRVSHRLEVALPHGLTIAGSETVVYGDRGLEMVYMLPIISYWSAQHYLGDLDNLTISLEAIWKRSKGMTLFGTLLVDEWRPQWTFKEKNHNWFGWQYGLFGDDIFVGGDHFRIEGSWTDQRIYRHAFPVNDYYSSGYPLGHWTGPHARSLSLGYRLPVSKGQLKLRYLSAKRGELTEQMLIDQYASIGQDRFSGETESLRSAALLFYWPTVQQFWLELGVTHNDWTNAGFDPRNPQALNEGDVQKWSFNFGLYRNFNLAGYDASFLFDGSRIGQ